MVFFNRAWIQDWESALQLSKGSELQFAFQHGQLQRDFWNQLMRRHPVQLFWAHPCAGRKLLIQRELRTLGMVLIQVNGPNHRETRGDSLRVLIQTWSAGAWLKDFNKELYASLLNQTLLLSRAAISLLVSGIFHSPSRSPACSWRKWVLWERTWFTAGLDSVSLMVGLDPKGIFQPKQFHDST